MVDVIIIAILVILIGAAVFYIVKEKKKGTKCIGCPAAGQCSQRKNGSSGCSSCHADKQEGRQED